MIISMTGFGKAVHLASGEADKKITVEIKSLNSKQLDLNVRMPGMYKEKELGLRSEIAKQLNRGKIDLGIFIEITGKKKKKYAINTSVVEGYFEELKLLSKNLKSQPPSNSPQQGGELQRTIHHDFSDYMNIIMKMPDVLMSEKDELDEDEWEKVKSVVDKAVRELSDFRIREGKVLEQDFITRIAVIQNLLKENESFESKRIDAIKSRIQKNLSELSGKDKIDENRFEQELIYYLEKIDITEEKIRLKTHCEYFLKTISEPPSDSPKRGGESQRAIQPTKENGKKLGFIAQEIGREINTIGSKANDANIQKIVVEMKDELEKIKEQLMNVL